MSLELHLPTLVVAVILMNGIAGGAVLFVGFRTPAAAGLRLWGLALLLNALQPLAFALRFVGPVALSILLANVLGVLVLMFLWDAVERFRGNAMRGPWLGGMVALPAVTGVIALLLRDREHLRNAFTTAVLAGLGVMALVAVLRRHDETGRHTRGQLLTATGGMLFVAVLTWRVVAVIAALRAGAPADLTNMFQAVTYLAILGCILMQTIGFVLWHQEVAAQRLQELATHDPLTGCLNRRALLEACEQLLRALARHPRPVALLLLDLDRFKSINDVHGHLAGDAVLRAVAERLRDQVRAVDRVARFGGEEFVVLADYVDDAGAMLLAERLRQAIAAEPVPFEGRAIPVTASIGVRASGNGIAPESLDAMLTSCDRALYRAKRDGRNRVEHEP